MKTSDVDILIVPDLGNASSDHWQSRWERSLKTARRIEQADWRAPRAVDWADNIVAAAQTGRRPAVIVAHGLGVLAVAHAAERLGATTVVGALLVAPMHLGTVKDGDATGSGQAPDGPGSRAAHRHPHVVSFWPVPAEPLPWPALVIASSDDMLCPLPLARELGTLWGADFTEAGNVGHIDTASGHGPWPEGLLRFGQFLRELG